MAADKRAHDRAPIELKVDYRKLNTFFADYTKNISKGGTFIRTQRMLPVGTRFLFQLGLPGRAEPFPLRGEVVHALTGGEEPGMGIRFVWSDEAERLEFERAVEALMAQSLGPHLAHRLMGLSRTG
jgi:type IV pilus assembly protein PilZ